jgi:hypothetical protein
MYIQLVDKDNFKSPVLYIHSDEDEFMEQIQAWKKDLHELREEYPAIDGLPLGRLEPDTAMIDLLRYLGNYYVESTPLSFLPPGHVYGCLRIMDSKKVYGEAITEINLHDE